MILAGCHRESSPPKLAVSQADCPFDVFWPVRDPEGPQPTDISPLLTGKATIRTTNSDHATCVARLTVTIARPNDERGRAHWNTALAFPHLDWMEQVRVWDADRKWLWPNLAYLLRLPGRERVERYGGMDPGKHVDNDFAAVLIREFDNQGIESATTQSMPLVSAEWHPGDRHSSDRTSVVHTAVSDEFTLHLGRSGRNDRGQCRIWLIYADFLGSRAPRTWPKSREYAGGVLAYFELDWQTEIGRPCAWSLQCRRPPTGTGFDWPKWAVRPANSESTESQPRLSDVAEPVTRP